MTHDPFTALRTPPPNFLERQATEVLGKNYGIDASFEPLAREGDQNFLATGGDGTKRVLKFANAYESASITDFQVQALLRVAHVAPDISVPPVSPTKIGTRMARLRAPGERLSAIVGHP